MPGVSEWLHSGCTVDSAVDSDQGGTLAVYSEYCGYAVVRAEVHSTRFCGAHRFEQSTKVHRQTDQFIVRSGGRRDQSAGVEGCAAAAAAERARATCQVGRSGLDLVRTAKGCRDLFAR